MIENKHIGKVIVLLMVLCVIGSLLAIRYVPDAVAASGSGAVTVEYEEKLFDTSQIITLNIMMEPEQWEELLANAIQEQYYACDVEVNGVLFRNVGIRAKGNTSLSSIAMDSTTDRYSFKLKFDEYVEGQTCFGLDKLALEAIEDNFLLRNYGTQDGNLYKPETMGMGEGPGGDHPSLPDGENREDFPSPWGNGERMEQPQDVPGEFPGNRNGGADLNYSDDNLSFGGMTSGGGKNDATAMINDAIDTPFDGTQFFDALLENEEYREKYHEYLRMLCEEYVQGGRLKELWERLDEQTDTLIAEDPTSFYTEEEYTSAKELLYKVIELRAQSVLAQIDGTIPSTESEQKEAQQTLIDATGMDLSVMGEFHGGGH